MRWIAFPLHPETPEEGLNLADLFKGRNVDIPALLKRLKRVADECGLPWGDGTTTYNSRRAQELGKWAESLGKGSAFDMAVFRAYFVDGLNIARIPVLRDLAESVGLDGKRAEEVLMKRTFKEVVDRDWEYSKASGVKAAPTFLVNGQRLVGAQPYETLVELVKKAGAHTRKAAASS